MKVTLTERECIVEREPGDLKFYGIKNAAGESRLLYYVKLILNAQGNDLIKKRMWKDGHLVDEMQQYLRTRSKNSPGLHIYIYNNRWQIEGAEKEYNRFGKVKLFLVRNVYCTGAVR